jgi:NADH-quinone oxidoreductase subunit C
MSDKLQNAIQYLKEKFNCTENIYRGEHTLFVESGDIVEACRTLRDDFGFDMLGSLTAVDYWPAESPRFHAVYQLHSIKHNISLRLRVPVEGINPVIPTIEGVFPNANWYEREIYDMFGILIEGHSDLRRIVLPHDWEGHPLRKDYPLGYEEVQFSFNAYEIDVTKPYVKE